MNRNKLVLFGFSVLASAFTPGASASEASFVMMESPTTWRSYLTVSGQAQGITSAYHSMPSFSNSTFEFKDASGANLAKSWQKRFSFKVSIDVESTHRKTEVRSGDNSEKPYIIEDSLGNKISVEKDSGYKGFDHRSLVQAPVIKYSMGFSSRYNFKDQDGKVIAELRKFVPETCSRDHTGIAFTGVVYDTAKIDAATLMSIAGFELRNARTVRYRSETIYGTALGLSAVSFGAGVLKGNVQYLLNGLAGLPLYLFPVKGIVDECW